MTWSYSTFPAMASRTRGAARVPGNITPTAEANIWSDPEAAEVVFAAGWPVTMIGLDVTHQFIVTAISNDLLYQNERVRL